MQVLNHLLSLVIKSKDEVYRLWIKKLMKCLCSWIPLVEIKRLFLIESALHDPFDCFKDIVDGKLLNIKHQSHQNKHHINFILYPDISTTLVETVFKMTTENRHFK